VTVGDDFQKQLVAALLYEGAQFIVIKIDPDGSGMDWKGHLWATIGKARRCCKNCQCIWGERNGYEIGPFIPGELSPLNAAARKIQDEINAFASR
jgi:hypothetical protein